jgi:DNA-binding NarL/FixJ family response regulator
MPPFKKIAAILPDVRALLSSDCDIYKEAKEIMARGCDAFIQKPFDLQGLSQKIRAVLDKE